MQSPVLATIELSVRLSVRPSDVGTVSKLKTTQVRITKSSPTDSARTLAFGIKLRPEIRKGSPSARALNESAVGKIRNFQPISRRKSGRVSETVQDTIKVTIND